MKVDLCLSSLSLNGIGTSIGIIHTDLTPVANDVDVVITSCNSGGDSKRTKRDGWLGAARKVCFAAS